MRVFNHLVPKSYDQLQASTSQFTVDRKAGDPHDLTVFLLSAMLMIDGSNPQSIFYSALLYKGRSRALFTNLIIFKPYFHIFFI